MKMAELLLLNIEHFDFFNPFALRRAKTPLSFGLSECKRMSNIFFHVFFHYFYKEEQLL